MDQQNAITFITLAPSDCLASDADLLHGVPEHVGGAGPKRERRRRAKQLVFDADHSVELRTFKETVGVLRFANDNAQRWARD